MDSIRALRDEWDRVLAVVLSLAGAVLLVLGWFGVSGQGLTSLQIPYVVSGGLGGIYLMGAGAALWLSADLRDEWRKLDRIEAALELGLERLGLGRNADGSPALAPLSSQPATQGDSMVGIHSDSEAPQTLSGGLSDSTSVRSGAGGNGSAGGLSAR